MHICKNDFLDFVVDYFPPAKRRKIKNGEKPQPSALNTAAFIFDDSIITDDILIEILIRLPNVQSVLKFATVSKRWFYVIWNLQFMLYFTHHRHKQASVDYDSYNSRPYTILLQQKETEDEESKGYNFNQRSSKHSKLLPGEPLLPNYLNFLPIWPFEIRASCDDLLLVSSSNLSHTSFYICNPLTRKWLALPDLAQANKYDKFALVCEPSSCNELLGCTNNIRYRFRVVLFDLYNQREVSKDNYQFDAAIFCSETWKWTNSIVSTPRRLRWAWCSPVVAYNGMLLWIEGQCIVARKLVFFYPFASTDAKRWSFIDLPSDLGSSWRSYVARTCLGVCQGRLRVSRLFKYDSSFYLKVWELRVSEDGGAQVATWLLVHNTSFSNNVSNKVTNEMHVASFDPNDGDIVFLLCDYHVLRCKISPVLKHEWESIAQFQNRVHQLSVFVLVHPPWPTAVSTLLPTTSPRHPLISPLY